MPAPRISFVSLGCPKALVDSERIITRLRAEGYEIARKHDGADVVIVNTCGFLDSARDESLEAIGEAMEGERQGDRHRLPRRRTRRSSVSAIRVFWRSPVRRPMRALWKPCTRRCRRRTTRNRRPHPASGRQADAAPLRLSEDFRRLQQSLFLLHHPCAARRPRLAAGGDVLREAERLVAAGVKELLVISQDTSAYGVDLKYAPGQVAGPRGARAFYRPGARTGRTRRLGADALRLPLPPCRRGDPADGGRQGAALSRHPLPACLAQRAEDHAPPGPRREDARPDRALA
jgi:ribosomal protein S12 methylthiotransferase